MEHPRVLLQSHLTEHLSSFPRELSWKLPKVYSTETVRGALGEVLKEPWVKVLEALPKELGEQNRKPCKWVWATVSIHT
jgi:hypothetical protein